MSNEKLVAGRIVRFKLSEGYALPALVVRAFFAEAHLRVFLSDDGELPKLLSLCADLGMDAPQFIAGGAPLLRFVEPGEKPGQWSWPPRGKEKPPQMDSAA